MPALPRWTRENPGKGKHGVPDKGAHKVGRQWNKQQRETEEKKDAREKNG